MKTFKPGDKILVKKTAVPDRRYNGLPLLRIMKHTGIMEVAEICPTTGSVLTTCGWYYNPEMIKHAPKNCIQ